MQTGHRTVLTICARATGLVLRHKNVPAPSSSEPRIQADRRSGFDKPQIDSLRHEAAFPEAVQATGRRVALAGEPQCLADGLLG